MKKNKLELSNCELWNILLVLKAKTEKCEEILNKNNSLSNEDKMDLEDTIEELKKLKSKIIGLMDDIKQEILSTYTLEDINKFKNFEEFFDEIDILNAYKESWQPAYYKPFYLFVYNEIKAGK